MLTSPTPEGKLISCVSGSEPVRQIHSLNLLTKEPGKWSALSRYRHREVISCPSATQRCMAPIRFKPRTHCFSTRSPPHPERSAVCVKPRMEPPGVSSPTVSGLGQGGLGAAQPGTSPLPGQTRAASRLCNSCQANFIHCGWHARADGWTRGCLFS